MANSYILHADVYRPSYGTARPHTPARSQLSYDDTDVNRIPLNARHRSAAAPTRDLHPRDGQMDPLISRTTRAYDVVIHYQRDSHGGNRWSREDIDHIHHIGRYLHGDVRDLKQWKAVIYKEGNLDAETMDKIRDDEEKVKRYCEQILDVIRDTERVPLWQRITRDEGLQGSEEGTKGQRESEYGGDDECNDLRGRAMEAESVDDGMYTDLEDKAEEIDQPIDARWATWATKPSTRFAW
ncbi:hypothetical protein ACET3X_007909 [Alternaria dauci]|uniref:Uncharacterized protein n=1 Tax=Alternaria dauci TaxID=48095 RepID=A0ABR3UES8_9PLEO